MTRKLALLSIGLAAALSVSGIAHAQSGTSSTAANPGVIRAGFLTGPSRLFKAAYDNKQFEGKSYRLELTEFATGQDQFAAFAAGNLDILFVDYASGVTANKRGLKMIYFSPTFRQPPLAYFLARGDKDVSTTNLKGKKIGLGPGPYYHVHTQKWIASLGYSASTEAGTADVQLVKIAEAALPSALANGDVDVIHTWDRISAYQWLNDFKFKFVQGIEGGAKVSGYLNPNPPTGGWHVNPEFFKKHPDLILAFDRDSRNATDWFFTIPAEEQRKAWEQTGGKGFSSLVKGLDQKTYDSLFPLRHVWMRADEKFDYAVISEWIDFVADITGSVPSSKEIDLRATIAPHLIK